MKVTIIYPVEPSYIFGLVDGLSKNKIDIDLIGSDRMKVIENKYSNVKLVNLRGSQDPTAGAINKLIRIIKFYLTLLYYIIRTKSKIIHLHWPNKIFFFDSTFLILFYKLFGKKIVYTAHNIDQGMRDKNAGDRKLVYKFLYKKVDHIIVHNLFSLRVLVDRFKVPKSKISVIKMGLIQAPATGISTLEARNFLKLPNSKKIILFFGGINEYKGLDLLLRSFIELSRNNDDYLLLIAGQSRDKKYFNSIKPLISDLELKNKCIANTGFIPYEDVEKYFMAADCIVLAYKYIFQSAVYTLSFSYGLPIIATDVGSFKEEDIIEGMNGFICKPDDADDLKDTIIKYFNSELYCNLESNRKRIKNWAEDIYSWDKIGAQTLSVYSAGLNH